MNAITQMELQGAELINQYYAQLQTINNGIAARADQPFPNREENAAIRQVTATLRVVRGKSPIVIAMETAIRMADKFNKISPLLAQQLLPQVCVMLFPGVSLSMPELIPGYNPLLNNNFSDILNATPAPSPFLSQKPAPLPYTPPADGLPSEELRDGITWWKGTSLDTLLPGGQTENGRSLPERMMVASLRADRPLLLSYCDMYKKLPLTELFGAAFERSAPLPRGEARPLPPAFPGHNAIDNTEEVPDYKAAWLSAPDGLPLEDTEYLCGYEPYSWWQGIPLNFTYPDGQTEDGRSILERIYCARYRNNKSEVERLLARAIDMPLIERYGSALLHELAA